MFRRSDQRGVTAGADIPVVGASRANGKRAVVARADCFLSLSFTGMAANDRGGQTAGSICVPSGWDAAFPSAGAPVMFEVVLVPMEHPAPWAPLGRLLPPRARR